MPGEGFELVDVIEGVMGSNKMQVWHVVYNRPDGTQHRHTIPKVAVNWRMAEYELETIEEAIDWLLYEPWAVDPTADRQPAPDPAMMAGLMRTTPLGEPDEPVTLYSAETIAEARQAQKLRIEEAKQRSRMKVGEPADGARSARGAAFDPIQVMKSTHTVDVDDVQEKRLVVRAVRQSKGLDLDKPRVHLRKEKNQPDAVRVDDGVERREMERRKDPKDKMYKKPLPKELSI